MGNACESQQYLGSWDSSTGHLTQGMESLIIALYFLFHLTLGLHNVCAHYDAIWSSSKSAPSQGPPWQETRKTREHYKSRAHCITKCLNFWTWWRMLIVQIKVKVCVLWVHILYISLKTKKKSEVNVLILKTTIYKEKKQPTKQTRQWMQLNMQLCFTFHFPIVKENSQNS